MKKINLTESLKCNVMKKINLTKSLKCNVMKKLSIILLLIVAIQLRGEDFTINNGGVRWGSRQGATIASLSCGNDLNSYIIDASGRRIYSLQLSGQEWGNHTINGDTTYSFHEFQVVASALGLGSGKEGSEAISSTPFNLAITQGRISGHSTVDKFGLNTAILEASDPEDVWEGGGLYIYDDFGTAPIISLVSTSALDSQTVEIQGLDIEGYLVTQQATLNGTTRVALDTALWRVFEMFNNSNINFVGQIECYIDTSSSPTSPQIRAIINNGNNQTLMAIYTIPKGKTGYLYRGEAGLEYEGGISPSTNLFAAARLYYKSRQFGKVFRVKKAISLLSGGNSVFQDERSFPDIIPELTDIRIEVSEVSDTIGVWATFDIVLIDN